MKLILLVDADIFAFKYAAKGQRKTPFGVAVDDLSVVTEGLDEAMRDVLIEVGADLLIICLSCPSAECWRKDILPSYKENRDEASRPVHLKAAKAHLADNYPSYRKDTLEADDVMGILSTMEGLPRNFVEAHPEFAGPVRKIIVSEDKDMKTIPGWLFNPAKDTKPWLVDADEAQRWHMYQTIVGDPTDGYKGCPSAGPKAAEEVLSDGALWESFEHTFKSGPRKGQVEVRRRALDGCSLPHWKRVVALYCSYGFTEADALVQAQVARICHASDFDFKNQKVIPWTPPSNPSTPATAPSAVTAPSPKKASRAGTPKGLTTGGK